MGSQGLALIKHNKETRMRYLFTLLLPFLLFGCTTLKNITDPLKEDKAQAESPSENTSVSDNKPVVDEVKLHFYRKTDLLTIGQRVELHVNDNEIGVLGHGDNIIKKVSPGKYELSTKVGLSIAIPVTGFGGACKFSNDYALKDAQHFFKIEFSPGIFCGEHEIIEISESAYKKLNQ